MNVKVGTRFSYDDLPPVLLQQLRKANKSGNVADNILLVLEEDLEGIASLNELLIAIYKRFGKTITRLHLSNTCSSLVRNGLLARQIGHKGIYKLPIRNLANQAKDEKGEG